MWCSQPAHEAKKAVPTRDDRLLRKDNRRCSSDRQHGDNGDNNDNVDNVDNVVDDDDDDDDDDDNDDDDDYDDDDDDDSPLGSWQLCKDYPCHACLTINPVRCELYFIATKCLN